MATPTDMATNMRPPMTPKRVEVLLAPSWRAAGLGVAALALAAPAAAQEPATRPPVVLVLGASLGVTATDNEGLTATNPRAEVVVEPGFSARVDGRSGRIDGFFDYRLTGLVYTRDTQENDVRHDLNAFAAGELVDDALFLDLGASITQQRLSAFGPVAPEPGLGNDNQVQVGTLRIAPRARGRLGANASWAARIEQALTRGEGDGTADVDSTGATLTVGNDRDSAQVLWDVRLLGNIVEFDPGRRTTEAAVRGSLGWSFERELALSAIVGRETHNFSTVERQASSIVGASVRWDPGPRTSLFAEVEDRYFGNGHDIRFSHRMPRTAFRYTDTHSVTTPQSAYATGSLGSAYDLLYFQYASIEPDAAKRKTLVESILRANGVDPLSDVVGDVLSSSVLLERRREFNMSWIGTPRTTVTLGASSTDSRRADTVTTPLPGDDFSSTDVVKRKAVLFNVAHQVTPLSTIAFDALEERTSGSLEAQRTTLRTVALSWSSQLGARTFGTLGARYSDFASPTDPYEVTTITAALRLEF